MNEMQVFTNPEFGKIRTVAINGEPWLAGADVAKALGYKNTKDALATHVDGIDKRLLQRSDIATFENHIPQSALPFDFVNGEIPNRGLTFINESGIYSLIFSSKLPSAKKFKRWVTSEVLPAIRKTGTYTMPSAKSPECSPVKMRELTVDDYIVAARLTSDCRNERLPYVLGFLEKGGFEIPKVKELRRDKPSFKLSVERTFINLDDYL